MIYYLGNTFMYKKAGAKWLYRRSESHLAYMLVETHK